MNKQDKINYIKAFGKIKVKDALDIAKIFDSNFYGANCHSISEERIDIAYQYLVEKVKELGEIKKDGD